MRIWYVISLCLFCACGTSKKSTDTERHATTSVSLSDSVFKKDSLSIIERILSNERLNAISCLSSGLVRIAQGTCILSRHPI